MKKFLFSLLCLSLFLGGFMGVNAAYSDVSKSESYYLSSVRLADLDIVSGYEDGTFRPDNTITRAEFTKIVVCMMNKEKEAQSNNSFTGFFDVDSVSWYTRYISYAVNCDILSGYADGSFRPNNTISVSEAVTILLRTLGYTEDEIGYFWPNNYISAASSLGITSGMDFAPSDAVTRKMAAVLVDRSLFTKPSVSLSPANTYLETTGYTVFEDSLILDSDEKSDSVTILSGNLKQNTASSYLSKTQLSVTAGDMYNYTVIDKNGYLVTAREYTSGENLCSVSGTLTRFTDNIIEYTSSDGLKGSYNADNSFVVYSGSEKLTVSQAKSRISSGTDITFYGNSYGLWNIAVVGNSDRLTPILAAKNYSDQDTYLGTVPINSKNLTVYRNGEASKLSEIKAGDVVYYNTKTNVIDVYAKKITGIYYSAYPSKAYVESVTVSGKSYDIGYSAATDKLNASAGAFSLGDKITLLLGKEGKIAFVTDNSSGFDYSSYGVILKSELRTAEEGENKGNTEYTATLFMADGEEHTIVTNKLYRKKSDDTKDSTYIGDFVSISYKNGVATLQKCAFTDASDYEGKIDRSSRTINGKYVLKDAAIIQRTSTKNADIATCELLSFDSLTATKLFQGQLLNAVLGNAFGDIAILYVDGLENTDSLGILTVITKNYEKGIVQYNIFSGGKQLSYTSSVNSAVSKGDAVSFRVENGEITRISPLKKLAVSSNITAIDGGRISIGKSIYSISGNVQIIDTTETGKIKEITIEDLEEMSSPSVTLYSDTAGGDIRVISVSR